MSSIGQPKCLVVTGMNLPRQRVSMIVFFLVSFGIPWATWIAVADDCHRREIALGSDANNIAGAIQERTTTVARVDRGIGLKAEGSQAPDSL